MATHSSTLAWKIPWMEEPGGLQSMGSQSRTRLSDFTFIFPFHALEKEMATHSSVLAWRIPGTGSLVGCRLWGCTESDMTEVTQQQERKKCHQIMMLSVLMHILVAEIKLWRACILWISETCCFQNPASAHFVRCCHRSSFLVMSHRLSQ